MAAALIIVGVIIIFVLIFVHAFSYYAYRIAFYHVPRADDDVYRLPNGEQYERGRERMTALIAELDSIPFEEVTIKAHDGTKLFGRYYHVADGAPLEIQFHGYHGAAIRDFCGGNKLAREAGENTRRNTLLVDERAHGRSGGKTITFGIKEKYDCAAWVDYACERFGSGTRILLSGVSMGAATVLMAAGLDLSPNVIGIMADSPYSSPEAIIYKVCLDRGFPPKPTMVFIRFGALLYGHFRLTGSATEAVKKATVPILIVHGEDDRFVPCEMAREIYDAAPDRITLETFPDAGHGISYIADTGRYAAVTEKFVSNCIKKAAVPDSR